MLSSIGLNGEAAQVWQSGKTHGLRKGEQIAAIYSQTGTVAHILFVLASDWYEAGNTAIAPGVDSRIYSVAQLGFILLTGLVISRIRRPEPPRRAGRLA